jgi:hypothetical protein
MNDLFLREFMVDLGFEGAYKVIEYETCHVRAKNVQVYLRREFDDAGRAMKEYAVIALRDRGEAADPTYRRSLVLVRKGNDLTPLPEVCGDLLTVLQPRGDHFAYYVFASTEICRDMRSISEETTSPEQALAESIASDEDDSQACPCVVDETTHLHEDTEQTGEAASPPAWWEVLDTPQSSAA